MKIHSVGVCTLSLIVTICRKWIRGCSHGIQRHPCCHVSHWQCSRAGIRVVVCGLLTCVVDSGWRKVVSKRWNDTSPGRMRKQDTQNRQWTPEGETLTGWCVSKKNDLSLTLKRKTCRCQHTAKLTPWIIICYFAVPDEPTAKHFEKQHRSWSVHTFAKRHIV